MAWRIPLLIAATLVAYVNAGGKTLSPQESAQFLQLFRRYCSSPASGPTQEGNTFFYCKTSDGGPVTQNLNHESEIASGDTPKQVIFVQPPSYQYIHNVALRGSPGNPQQTDIYVLPPTAEHNVQLQDTRTSVQAQKPSLYFLSNDQQQQGQQGGNQIGLPSPVAGSTGSTGFSSQRPSAPPPRPSNPNVIGIESNGYPQQLPQPQQPQLGGYNTQSQAYGAPAAGPALSPRNQRNLRGSHFGGSSSAIVNSRYSVL